MGVRGALREGRVVHGPIISVGHSVGGQLALLTSDRVDAVVVLAPVTDVVRTFESGAGDDAAREYFRRSPEEDPETYAEASAITRLPLRAPTLVVHGTTDTRVAVDHSRTFVDQAWATGSSVQLREFTELSHLDAIDPGQEHWPDVLEWMLEQSTG